jgi:nucleoid-associated protein YgaU
LTPQSPSKPKPPILQQYTVEKGDTLTAIAARVYGTRSKRVIDAIFEVNTSLLSSPDELRVGQVIALPRIEGLAAPAEETTPAPAEEPKPPAADPPPEHRPYQVRKGDAYVTIAREQLGSAGRWKEIAELNKDIFPDPSKIRHGVRIRLPIDAGPSAPRNGS